VIIKQEKKVKSERVSEEEMKNQEEKRVSSSVYEHMFNTVAAGLVVDELPKDMIPRFLEAI
jgi:hypothetical protein